jgi:putative Ca2+/H+ antiporter (TMEM165/GDT1 family)
MGAWFDVGVALTAFALVFPAELPDKTFVATLVLATRFRPLWAWTGVVLAFAVQCAIAVTAGGLLSLLPGRWVAALSAALFAAGAVLMLRSGLAGRRAAQEAEAAEEAEFAEAAERAAAGGASVFRQIAASFGVLFLAEWGDLSQLLTAGLAASTGEPLSVGVGAWLALACVAGIAVTAGRWLTARVPLHRVSLISAGILAVLAVITGYEAITGA